MTCGKLRRTVADDRRAAAWQFTVGLLLLASLQAMLAGCATVTFRRGAQPEAMLADERACRADGADEAAFVECMRRRGWTVATTGLTTSSAPVAMPPTATDGGETAVEAALPQQDQVVDPTTSGRVDRWWKRGGNPDDLDRAIDACVALLGDEHRPNPAATDVTIALRDCLRAAGWRALGGSTSP